MFTILSEHFEFRHFRPHYLDVDTIFGDLRRECLHQHRSKKYHIWKSSAFRSFRLWKTIDKFEQGCCYL